MNFLWIEKPRGVAISKTNPVMDRHEIVRPPMVQLDARGVEDPIVSGKSSQPLTLPENRAQQIQVVLNPFKRGDDGTGHVT